MRYIKLFESFESFDRDDIEDILLPLKDIGIEYEIDREQILGKDFISFEIKKFKVKTRRTIPDYFENGVFKKDAVYMASFDTRRNTYMTLYHNEVKDVFHSSHLDIIGWKWKDIRDEVLHLVSFMLDEGYFLPSKKDFFYNNSIKVSEVISPSGKGLTWMEEDVLKKYAGKEIEMLESLDPEANIAELRISFAKKI